MVIRFLKEKWKRILIIVTGSLIAAILIGAMLLNLYWSPILAGKLKTTVLNSTDGLYKIDFSDAELHILQGKIVIYNLDFKPDTSVYRLKTKLHQAPNNLYNLHIQKLVLTHIHPFRLYFKQQLDIGQIVISAPELAISYQKNYTHDTTSRDDRTVYQKISKTLKSIHIGNILLNDVNFKYTDFSGIKVVISELKEMNLNATDLLIDSASQTDKSRFYFCQDVTAEINNFHGKTLNGLYQYQMKLLKLSTSTAQLNVEGIDVTPADTSIFFRKSMRDRFTFHMDSLQLNKFDFLTYHKYRQIFAASMSAAGGGIAIFNNPRPVAVKVDKSPTFPNAGIYRLKTDLKIDTLNLSRINVSYTEYSPNSKKTGTVTFNNTSGRFLNLTTDSTALLKNNLCDIQLASYLMNKGRVDVNFKFNLTDKNLPYSYKGTVGPMNLQTLNAVTMPLVMVKITSGKLVAFDFDIKADKNVAKGFISMRYDNLKVNLLKMDSVRNKYKRMTLESFFANAFIIKHNNPDNEGEKPRTFYVNYRRPPEYAFFKTVFKTLLGGIKACAGYGEQKEKEIKQQMAERAVLKVEKIARKARKQQARELRKKNKALKKQQKLLEQDL